MKSKVSLSIINSLNVEAAWNLVELMESRIEWAICRFHQMTLKCSTNLTLSKKNSIVKIRNTTKNIKDAIEKYKTKNVN